MTLQELVAPLLNQSDAAIVTQLNAATVNRTDTTRYTWAGLMLRFSPQLCMELSQVIAAIPGSAPILSALTNPGIDFSLDATQSMLDQLASALGAEHTVNLKAIGRFQMSPYRAAGFAGDVTEDQVAAARQNITLSRIIATNEAKVTALLNDQVWPAVARGDAFADIQALWAGAQ